MTDVVAAAISDPAYVVVALGGLLVSVGAVTWGVVTGRRSNLSSLESILNGRIHDLTEQLRMLKDELKECNRRGGQLERENIRLMRRIIKLENGHDEGAE